MGGGQGRNNFSVEQAHNASQLPGGHDVDVHIASAIWRASTRLIKPGVRIRCQAVDGAWCLVCNHPVALKDALKEATGEQLCNAVCQESSVEELPVSPHILNLKSICRSHSIAFPVFVLSFLSIHCICFAPKCYCL